MNNMLKSKLTNGNKAVGTFFHLGSQTAMECLGISGLDFIIIDMEHAAFGPESVRSFIMTSERYQITPLVRIPCISRDLILRSLDSGAGGIVIPAVETPDQVLEALRHAKYPSQGNRGFSFPRAFAYGNDEIAQNPLEYCRHCNEETLIIPQCETRGCLENIEEIVAIDGVDGIFIGPYDLSNALGRPADFENPEYKAAIQRVKEVTLKSGKFLLIYSGSAEDAKVFLANDYSGVVLGMDVNILINTYRSIVETVKSDC